MSKVYIAVFVNTRIQGMVKTRAQQASFDAHMQLLQNKGNKELKKLQAKKRGGPPKTWRKPCNKLKYFSRSLMKNMARSGPEDLKICLPADRPGQMKRLVAGDMKRLKERQKEQSKKKFKQYNAQKKKKQAKVKVKAHTRNAP